MSSWWNKNISDNDGNRKEDFVAWIKNFNEEDRIYCRTHIKEKEYKSMLDVGCGLCVEYHGFKSENHTIDYSGVDGCKFFINENTKIGIKMIEAELEEKLPIEDNQYDIVYCRDILEHLSYYKKTLNEVIRVAKKEVIVNWFIKPGLDPTWINYWEDEDLYHNRYNKDHLEKFIMSNEKVESISWRDINNFKNVLHINLKG